ncbi:hypothetical protein OAJ04_04705 [Candidatus Nitrosopelagicus sp.]|nr:hypothetical protein [Candidatus Nitrosopelagicus sp.]
MAKSKKVTAAEEANKKQKDAEVAKAEYIKKMKAKGATLPKGFISDAKANTGH